ncbi:MAG: hypothetical protein MNSN_10310 [Minisyncoccus archaeiphilus]|uniref:hypothetical protein n=1 Tax=Minisyncoccus archaeiphilus TaxID=3238481 RepID=UPI002B0BEFD8|nr:MAG: hypothetical protein MNSN_10310 [Candidatus Parcubacteria bacterium]
MTKKYILLIIIFPIIILFFFPKNYENNYYYIFHGQEHSYGGGCFDICIGINISKKIDYRYQNTCFGIIYSITCGNFQGFIENNLSGVSKYLKKEY